MLFNAVEGKGGHKKTEDEFFRIMIALYLPWKRCSADKSTEKVVNYN
jgi:hypothetical protein